MRSNYVGCPWVDVVVFALIAHSCLLSFSWRLLLIVSPCSCMLARVQARWLTTLACALTTHSRVCITCFSGRFDQQHVIVFTGVFYFVMFYLHAYAHARAWTTHARRLTTRARVLITRTRHLTTRARRLTTRLQVLTTNCRA